jgi:peptidoglycan/xylan/chitin deacetylase (PgdA/CDA1 family)
MTAILFTIDTEVYPINSGWEEDCLKADIERDIYGVTPSGRYGLVYQLEMLARNHLKAIFFVEALFASCSRVGLGPLREIVRLIYSYGQEIQLHLHPEWIPHLSNCPVAFQGNLIRDYSKDDQRILLEMAMDNLINAGAIAPVAFRAGDYAANENTLKALVELGFRFDSSFNYPYCSSTCGLSIIGPMWHASPTHGLWEVPISCFQDWPGHYRHCQLCACSTAELSRAIDEAVSRGWDTFTLICHSCELLTNRWSSRPVAARPSVIRRFEELCLGLARRTDVETAHFADLSLKQRDVLPIRGSVKSTAGRYVEQLISRVHSRFARA